MKKKLPKRIPYFPGCSLATTAKENNDSMKSLFKSMGIRLVELRDWSCCGSSSAHCIDSGLAVDLAARNLSLAPVGRPLLVACPSCMMRLTHAHLHLSANEDARRRYEEQWGRKFDPDLEIIHFFDLLERAGLENFQAKKRLDGLRFVPYYGCMLARPPEMAHLNNHRGMMEKMLISLGAEEMPWGYEARCCGSFLSVVRPDVVTPLVDEIMLNAKKAGADCIVTACAMCHLNLEIRCTIRPKAPILHFSELLAIALGKPGQKQWFSRHIIDPTPVFEKRGLL